MIRLTLVAADFGLAPSGNTAEVPTHAFFSGNDVYRHRGLRNGRIDMRGWTAPDVAALIRATLGRQVVRSIQIE
jgi:hypothetical protein